MAPPRSLCAHHRNTIGSSQTTIKLQLKHFDETLITVAPYAQSATDSDRWVVFFVDDDLVAALEKFGKRTRQCNRTASSKCQVRRISITSYSRASAGGNAW